MVGCVAYGCTNRSSGPQKISGITFHRFPKDEERKRLWIKAVNRENWAPSTCSKLCSAHFSEEMIDRTSIACVKLRDNAIPTIFEGFPSYLQKKYKPRKSQTSQRSASSVPSENLEVGIASTSGYLEINESNVNQQHSHEDSESCLRNSPDKNYYKRKVEELSDVVHTQQKKVKVLQQKCRRFRKRIENLSALFNDLREKRYMNDEALEVLKTVSDVNEEFLSRQLASVTDQPMIKKYSPQIRSFALTLHFYSPRAYEYVRKTFNLALPHQRTLVRWYQHINGDPGFTEEAFSALHSKIVNSPYPLYFSLMFDEMAIRQHVEYDGKQVHGHISIGINENDDSLPLAKEAFVLLLVCINGHWKLPLGYFLTDGISSEQRADILRNCLMLLHSKQCNVISVTFDGLSSNFNMMRQLGCSTDIINVKSVFPHPSDSSLDVAVFLDPSHMLKLIRNAFGDKKSLFHDGIIDWKYIVALHKLQEAEGLNLNNKLRSAHFHFYKQKMKVKLAAQLFSNSVADAIEYCNLKLQLNEFKGSEETVKFIRMFNNLFDILNSRSIKHSGLKKALCKNNLDQVRKHLKEADEYINKLTVSNGGEKMLTCNRKTGFLGFKICIKSIFFIINKYIVPEDIKLIYFPFYKISQDHIELFFSSIRFHGGSNNNPTARQFRAAYKKLLVSAQLKSCSTGNCIPLSEITILGVPNHHSPESIINMSSSSTKECFNVKDTDQDTIDHDYVFNAGFLSEASKDIIYYIAGYVSKKLMSTLKCEQCINVLCAKEVPSSITFISYKSNGKLIYPSEDVFQICKQCEKTFRRIVSTESSRNIQSRKTFIMLTKEFEILNLVATKTYFPELICHQMDNDPLDNHYIHLIRAIIKTYMHIRYSYYYKNIINRSNSIRHLYTKSIIFKGQ